MCKSNVCSHGGAVPVVPDGKTPVFTPVMRQDTRALQDSLKTKLPGMSSAQRRRQARAIVLGASKPSAW